MNTPFQSFKRQHKESPSAPKYVGLLILVFFVFILGWNVGASHMRIQLEKVQKTNIYSATDSLLLKNIDMDLFWDAWQILNDKYADPDSINYNKMLDGAIHGLVTSFGDPYTAYMNPKENQEFQNNLEGMLDGGIGAELTLKNNQLTVVSPLKKSPASRAGLQPEDVIIKINGQPSGNFTLEQAVNKIRGPKGSPVTLTILRKNTEKSFEIRIVRDAINIDSVNWRMKDNIAIIEINQFSNKTQEEFSQAINKALSKSPQGLILDLRFNGGGYLDSAVAIASEFIEKGKVVTIKKRDPADDEVIYVNGKARVTTLPMVVLINKGSASASEIVAGALQDYKRAYLIGEQSFGKGTVQEVDNLIGGSSLRVTIAKWYTPNDKNITEVGITPNLTVARTTDDFQKGRDPQLDAAFKYLNENH
ncbi:S41 family peptidase [Candidatus Peregrinibacteria bacterium]|nr:S41 family peptidase [Candidatus Peregrinibacteria bacterium]